MKIGPRVSVVTLQDAYVMDMEYGAAEETSMAVDNHSSSLQLFYHIPRFKS